MTSLAACEGEKDLNIITDPLPIKTSTLYMVGSATPNGWDINNPTPMTASADDALVFSWEGNLYAGEMKLCLTTGSWDVGFIRPMMADEPIGIEPITNASFQMHAGDPDEKWKITESGTYRITFNLRNWTMSTLYVGETEQEPVKPIETESLYIVGEAAPCGWDINAPFELTKVSQYVFTYEGRLKTGQFKAVCSIGSWDVPFFRPMTDNLTINKEGVADPTCQYVSSPDNKWYVADAGTYRLTFDLENYTIKAEFLAEDQPVTPSGIDTNTLFIVGDACENGWSLDNATRFSQDQDNKFLFFWEGNLKEGEFKACIKNDAGFGVPFLHPKSADVVINENGVSAPDFLFYEGGDDFKWKVTKAGKYRVMFDLQKYTISATYLD